MSVRAVKLVQYTTGLTLAEYVVLISLASLADKDDWRCSPSLTALAAISNIEKKTAIRAIRRLTAPYLLPDLRSLVSLVENRKVTVRNHTYELNVALLRELREKRRKLVPAPRSKRRKSVPRTLLIGEVKTDITHLSRKQVRESIAAAVKETIERARALAATPSSAVTQHGIVQAFSRAAEENTIYPNSANLREYNGRPATGNPIRSARSRKKGNK